MSLRVSVITFFFIIYVLHKVVQKIDIQKAKRSNIKGHVIVNHKNSAGLFFIFFNLVSKSIRSNEASFKIFFSFLPFLM